MGARNPHTTPTELALSQLLDRFLIRYEYEPREFRLHTGGKIQGFRPDFYLPDHGLYIEAGARSSKEGKLRAMRKLYPNIRVVIYDNAWINELPLYKNKDSFLQAMFEAWIEQEYYDEDSLFYRQEAREAHRQAKIDRTFGPSMRYS
jgi:hypothetical protein